MEKNFNLNKYLQSYITQADVFNEEECKYLINFAENKTEKTSILPDNNFYGANAKVIPVENKEMSNIINSKLSQFINNINSRYYNFKISELKELQIIKVSENDFSDLHYDIGKGIKSTRKLSMIVFLSKIDDYSGGQITFSLVGPEINARIQKHGSMLLFPSIKPYMSEPVLKGTRYTLVGWMHGDPFV